MEKQAFAETSILQPCRRLLDLPHFLYRFLDEKRIATSTAIIYFFHNMRQGMPNLGFMQEKVQNGDFLKVSSRKLKNYFCFMMV